MKRAVGINHYRIDTRLPLDESHSALHAEYEDDL
jgi:hypothetical protein